VRRRDDGGRVGCGGGVAFEIAFEKRGDVVRSVESRGDVRAREGVCRYSSLSAIGEGLNDGASSANRLSIVLVCMV
jgi:hypothetical protein